MRSLARKIPGWIYILAFLSALVVYSFLNSQKYQDTLPLLLSGVLLTVRISLISLLISLCIGLTAGFARASKHPALSFPFGFYVEVVRGTPTFVTILYVAFVLAPLISRLIGIDTFSEAARAIVALAFASGAFMAEDFRAGIESIRPGQMEAAQSIGMSNFQAMRFVILPQAIRNVLPALGNDFIGLLKDSSLASLIAVKELTHLGRLNVGLTFDTFTTWNLVAILYLTMTLGLSAGTGVLERKFAIR